MLLYFVRNKDVVLTREDILNNVWGLELDEGFSIVDIYINRLRAKLKGKGKTITTVMGIGYKFEEDKWCRSIGINYNDTVSL